MKKNAIIQDKRGLFVLTGSTKKWDSFYSKKLLEYINLLFPIFDKAKNVSEFEFIFSLLGFRGLQGPGWDTFDNTIQFFDSIESIKIKDEFSKINFHLWVYGHIIEASEPYELYANFFRIIDGERYTINNFPDKDRGKHKVPQFPVEKIEALNEIALKLGLQDCLIPLNEVFDKDLRNSIFHSDYSIYKGSIRTRKPIKEFSRNETYDILNKGVAYFQALKFLYEKSISDYKEPKDVILPIDFNAPTGKIIVRKNFGVVGLCDDIDILPIGAPPFRVGKFKDYEIEILNKNKRLYILPEDKIEKAFKTYNQLYSICPKFLRKYLNNWNHRRVNNIKYKLIKHYC
jgi:hypothetical protein